VPSESPPTEGDSGMIHGREWEVTFSDNVVSMTSP